MMKAKNVNIDFTAMQKEIKKAVKAKALQFGSSIIDLKDGELVEKPSCKNHPLRLFKRGYTRRCPGCIFPEGPTVKEKQLTTLPHSVNYLLKSSFPF